MPRKQKSFGRRTRARSSSAPVVLCKTRNRPSKRKCWTNEQMIATLVPSAGKCNLQHPLDTDEAGPSSSVTTEPEASQTSIDSDIDENVCCMCFGSYTHDVVNGDGREWITCASYSVIAGFTKIAQMIVSLMLLESRDCVTIVLTLCTSPHYITLLTFPLLTFV